jgi:DNA-binding IscR family transcriptional regulator
MSKILTFEPDYKNVDCDEFCRYDCNGHTEIIKTAMEKANKYLEEYKCIVTSMFENKRKIIISVIYAHDLKDFFKL